MVNMNNEKTERNAALYSRYIEIGPGRGTLPILAEEFGMTRQCVHAILRLQIVKKGCVQPIREMLDARLPAVKVSAETRAALVALAQVRGWKIAYAIRQAIKSYLENERART